MLGWDSRSLESEPLSWPSSELQGAGCLVAISPGRRAMRKLDVVRGDKNASSLARRLPER